jgi:spore germination protein YaaH
MKIKLHISILIISLFIFQSIQAQEKPHISIHQEQLSNYGLKEKALSKFDNSGKDIIPLQQNQAKALKKIVFGFLPDWEYAKGAHNNIHYELLSHIAVFNFLANSAGDLSNPSGWPWTDVINKAHTNGTKVIMAVTNFGGTEDSDTVAETIMTSSASKNNFFNKVKGLINTYQLDGVNIDFEGLDTDFRGDILNTFMGELSDFIHTNLPGKEVSFDGPAVNWGGWKLEGLTKNVDHLFIMAYDYNGSWSTKTGAVSPLTCTSGKCINTSLNTDYKDAKSKYPEKLILGVPYYGKHWEASSSSAGATVTKYIGSTFYRDDVLNAPKHGGYLWNTSSQTSWYRWQGGSIWNQVWSDNEKSLSKKYDTALSQALGGVGIWALNYDDTRTELWNLINTKFGDGAAIVPSMPISVAAIRKDATTITLKFLAGNDATSYEVLQSTDNTGFTVVKEDTATEIDITGLTEGEVYYFKVRSKNAAGVSAETEVLSAMPSPFASKVLIVDGLTRSTFDAITQYDYPLTQLNITFSSASAEAVTDGVVDMKNFNFVIWMLLNESSNQDTFNKSEQAKVKEYIDAEGVFITSGSEIGWDLVAKGDTQDKSFYNNYLKANYLADGPGGSKDTYYTAKNTNGKKFKFDDGTHGIINVSWPDEIEATGGSSTSFTYDGYSGTGVAGISWQNGDGGVEHLAFPIEAVYNDTERKDLLDFIFSKYSGLLGVDDSFIKTNLALYPNPTRGLLKISNPNAVQINKVEIFNMYGQRIALKKQAVSVDLSRFSSGIYFVRVEDTEGNQGTFKVIKQ